MSEMNSFTREAFEKFLESNELDKLIGQFENDWFECKAQPYLLQTEGNKRELAKDVSAFANANGGYIVLGAKTIKEEAHLGDKVELITPFDPQLIDKDQILKICENWIFPKPQNLDLIWIASNDDSAKGVAVIKIPAQSESNRPFLIKNVLSEEKKVEIMFGYVERIRDTGQSYELRDIHNLLKLGLNFEKNIQKRFYILEGAITSSSAEDAGNNKSPYDRAEDIAFNAISVLGLSDGKVFALTAIPIKPTMLTTFATGENGATRLVNNPPHIPTRFGGWTLSTHYQPEIVRGELIRGLDPGYKVFEIHRDGSMVFVTNAGEKFLSWGSKDKSYEKINQLALIESIYNFSVVYQQVIKELDERPNEIGIRIDLAGMRNDEGKSYLAAYGLRSFGETKDAPDNALIRFIKIPVDLDVRIVAFKIVREVYLWFGLDDEKIPYTVVENDVMMIDPEKIKEVG